MHDLISLAVEHFGIACLLIGLAGCTLIGLIANGLFKGNNNASK